MKKIKVLIDQDERYPDRSVDLFVENCGCYQRGTEVAMTLRRFNHIKKVTAAYNRVQALLKEIEASV